MHEEGRQHDEDEHLQELRLPVLERRLCPAPDIAAVAERSRDLAGIALTRDVLDPTRPGLQSPGSEEQTDQGDAQPVVTPDPTHMSSDPSHEPLSDDGRSSAPDDPDPSGRHVAPVCWSVDG